MEREDLIFKCQQLLPSFHFVTDYFLFTFILIILLNLTWTLFSPANEVIFKSTFDDITKTLTQLWEQFSFRFIGINKYGRYIVTYSYWQNWNKNICVWELLSFAGDIIWCQRILGQQKGKQTLCNNFHTKNLSTRGWKKKYYIGYSQIKSPCSENMFLLNMLK